MFSKSRINAATLSASSSAKSIEPSTLRYEERAKKTTNPASAQLFNLMATKKSNLALSLDVHSMDEFERIVRAVGEHICLLKTHIDIIDDFDPKTTVAKIKALAKEYNFIIFEDRKFADIPNTTGLQYTRGVFKIGEWADIVNAHLLPGSGIIAELKNKARALDQADLLANPESTKRRGLIMLAEMTSEGNYFTPEYTKAVVEQSEDAADFVMGFITKNVLSEEFKHDFINFTPGINLTVTTDNKGQVYQLPQDAMKSGTDVGIVGRGIYGEKTIEKMQEQAIAYKNALWAGYEKRVELVLENTTEASMSMRI